MQSQQTNMKDFIVWHKEVCSYSLFMFSSINENALLSPGEMATFTKWQLANMEKNNMDNDIAEHTAAEGKTNRIIYEAELVAGEGRLNN